jgi:hypothetical protein
MSTNFNSLDASVQEFLPFFLKEEGFGSERFAPPRLNGKLGWLDVIHNGQACLV